MQLSLRRSTDCCIAKAHPKHKTLLCDLCGWAHSKVPYATTRQGEEPQTALSMQHKPSMESALPGPCPSPGFRQRPS
eukprot:1567613-Amphidinium_carterae.1